MTQLVGRRDLLAGVGVTLIVGALGGCDRAALRPTSADRLVLPQLRAHIDRISAVTVCTRPFRAEGPRLDVERVAEKTTVHNDGHGGSGWSLSWGSGSIARGHALATGERDIAVIGCGALGLTSGVLLQHASARVTIYAKELPPMVRSSLATGVWSPDSWICLAKYATPDFKRTWESMARLSYRTYQSLVGLADDPVEYLDVYSVDAEDGGEWLRSSRRAAAVRAAGRRAA